MSLDKIARRYATDKYFDRPGSHNYTPFYDQILKDRQVRNMLEIGVFNGDSLFMWRKYFKKAMIYGWDIVDTEFQDKERIRVYKVNQGNQEEIEHFFIENPVQFDFVIDDGSHNAADQAVSLFNIWPYLSPGGIYIIEDINHDWFDCFLKNGYRNEYFFLINERLRDFATDKKVLNMVESLVCVQKNNVAFSSSYDKEDHIFYVFYK